MLRQKTRLLLECIEYQVHDMITTEYSCAADAEPVWLEEAEKDN